MASLKKGSKGESVRQLQVLIQFQPQDGIFDEALDKRVRTLQKLCKVKVDGVVGPKTMAALGPYMDTYRNFVKEIQNYFGFVPTGIYDKLTRDNVKFSQQNVGLKPNEDISGKDWKALVVLLKKKAENNLKPIAGVAPTLPDAGTETPDDIQIGDNPKEDFEDEEDREEQKDTDKMDVDKQKTIKIVAGVITGVVVLGGLVWWFTRKKAPQPSQQLAPA
jgi:peptidoglycan hydrolase-like protein with peptidoglycan-binding domain